MARAPALANQMADRLVTLFQTIDNVADANKWLSKPLDVHREFRTRDLTIGVTPLIAIECHGWKSSGRGASQHEKLADFEIHCVTRGPTKAEETAINVASDVETAIMQDEHLAGLLTEEILEIVVVFNVELSQAVGLCVFTVTFQPKADFDHSTATPS